MGMAMTSIGVNRMDKFSIIFYVQAVFGIMRHPGKFFSRLPQSSGMTQALGFLILSAVFFSTASQIHTNFQNFFVGGGIHMFNAVGMVFILSGLGYGVMTLSIGKKVGFARLFGVYALCSGVTLLVSWVPHLVLFTEPWKWYLIGTGMTRGCGLKPKEALLIMAISLGIWYLFFRTIMATIIR
jgi:hypothetical protein